MSAPAYAPSAIGMRRLASQRASGTPFAAPDAMLHAFAAIQGQDFPGTKWAIAARVAGATERTIDAAIADRAIVRIWAMRGTLHYAAREDAHWLIALVADRLIAATAARRAQLNIPDAQLPHIMDHIADLLHTHGEMTRSDLFAHLNARGVAVDSQRGYHLMLHAGLRRILMQGAMRGADTTFAPLVPGEPIARDEAAALLAGRYFTSRGPATIHDFAYWSGLTMGEARAALEANRADLLTETIDGVNYFSAGDGPGAPGVHLLPGFDEFILGYRDRGAVLDPAFADAICPGANGIFKPIIVADGRVVGIWKRTVKKKHVEIALTPFYPFAPGWMDGIAAAADRFGAFLGLPAKITG